MNKVMSQSETDYHPEDLFAEKFGKVVFRDFQNNTRMDIKNVDLKNQQIKRDRMMEYWQHNVVENFLPPISAQKRSEIQRREKQNETLTVKRIRQKRNNSAAELVYQDPMP